MKEPKMFFPPTLTASLLESWNTCNLKAFRTNMQHLHSGRESSHLVAGGAYAKALETCRRAYFAEGQDLETAMALGEAALIEEYGDFVPYSGDADKKSLQSMTQLYWEYHNTFPMDADSFIPALLEDGSRAVEFPFSIELPYLHPELGIPLKFVGRFDALVEFQDKIYGLDDKTRGGYPTRAQKDSDKLYGYMVASGQGKGVEEKTWATRGQFTAYVWAMQQLGISLDGFVIREAWIQSASSWYHRQVFTPRRQSQVDLWEKQMHRQIQQMLAEYKRAAAGEDPHSVFNMVNDSASCVKYGSVCPFMEFCTGETQTKYMEGKFRQDIWIPEMAITMPLEDYINYITNGEGL